MPEYMLRRIMMLAPVLLITSFISYALICLCPGDPARLVLEAQLQGTPSQAQVNDFRADHGLNQPLMVQYVTWLKKAALGDLGKSLKSGDDVWDDYRARFVVSAKLFLAGELIAVLIALPLGIWSAVKANSIIDNILRVIALGGVSLPGFLFGMLLIYVCAVRLHLLPAIGYGKPANIVLPALTLGITGSMSLMRLTRTSLLEVLKLNYVRTARAKGLRERPVITRHVLRNALVPVITAIGMHFGHIVGGMAIIETLFAWPGLGMLLVDAASTRDIPVIQSFVLLGSAFFVGINLLIDLIYTLLDPRISYRAKEG